MHDILKEKNFKVIILLFITGFKLYRNKLHEINCVFYIIECNTLPYFFLSKMILKNILKKQPVRHKVDHIHHEHPAGHPLTSLLCAQYSRLTRLNIVV